MNIRYVPPPTLAPLWYRLHRAQKSPDRGASSRMSRGPDEISTSHLRQVSRVLAPPRSSGKLCDASRLHWACPYCDSTRSIFFIESFAFMAGLEEGEGKDDHTIRKIPVVVMIWSVSTLTLTMGIHSVRSCQHLYTYVHEIIMCLRLQIDI